MHVICIVSLGLCEYKRKKEILTLGNYNMIIYLDSVSNMVKSQAMRILKFNN